MGKSIVGLDLAANTIRAVEVADADKARPTVVRFAEVPTPPDSIRKGEVIEPNTVAGALRQLWHVGKFRTKNVVLGVGNQRVLSRDLTIPKSSREQIRESLPFQVQDMLPVPVGDAILDFYPVSEAAGENGPVLHGLLVAAIKDAVLANVKAVQLAGLNPAAVDLIPFALSRVAVTRQQLAGTVAMVELGAETTSVVVITDGVPQFVRIIPTGGNDVTKLLSARFEIGWDEAESIKRHFGLGGTARTSDDARAVAVITESSSELFASLRNTVSYFVNTRPGQAVTKILLAGGGAKMPGFASALSDHTRIPVAMTDPFAGVARGRSITPDALAARGTAVAVAFGLAVGSKAA
ncbi:type IV pilus assembly protein PilM [Curtobacterium sp. MCPF17_046]|uniref:type IV pilus assembly protein PilM n=1 Tax=Curtobacterium sp. MCPF17_046 TaxID=2175663 RepID=UPI000D8FFEC5|nr:type IV pilus assembly protein PilM [Curtobacterium sp. MCPF17_046]PYY41532.1 pilus assembly protein PilM [Curtobacterium sp. MCPF17_046]